MRAPQGKSGLVTFVTIIAALLLACDLASAQTTMRLCYNNATATGCIPVNAVTGLPVSVIGGSSSLSATATAAAPSYVEGTNNPLSMDLSGNTRVIATGLAQGSTTAGQTGSLVLGAVTTSAPTYTNAQTSPVSLRTDGASRTGLYAGIEGGCTPGKLLSAASTNATNIKSSAGTLCKFVAINTAATIYYLKFYNTSGSPTCNSDTVVGTFPVPPSNGGVAIPLGPFGEAYTTGISFCLTGGLADNDNTSAATGVALSYSFK